MRRLSKWLVIMLAVMTVHIVHTAPLPLPADLAAITITATGKLSSDFVLVHLFAEKGFKGYALVTSDGRIAWWYRTQDYPFGAARRQNGNFVFMDKGYGLVEVDRTGTIVHELRQRDAERELHHGIVVTTNDTVLYLAFDTESYNGARLKGEAIWEWSPDTGADVKRWRSWDHLSPALDRSARTAGEWLHGNSLALGAAGNILFSTHYLDQVISIAPDWKTVQWRLGGIRPTVAMAAGEAASAQHTPAEVAPNRILMFDNRTGLPGEYSRAVEYELRGGRARVRWQWRPDRDNYSSAVGSARRLSNGNTLVAFGMEKGRNGSTGPTEAYEVTPGGQVAWHLMVQGVMTMFRVEPVNGFEP